MLGPLAMMAACGVPAAFSPSDIAGLEAWYDASDTATITDTSGSVTAWADKSGNANHAAASVNNAITGTRTINSLNALDLQSNVRMTLYTPAVSTMTIFVVALSDLAFGGKRLISSYDGAGGLVNGEYIIDGIATNKLRFLTPVANITTGDNAFTTSATHIVTMQNSTGVGYSLLRLDGTQFGGPGTAASSTAPIRPLSLGEDNPIGGSEYWDGLIGEILIYETTLSGTNIDDVEEYLADKWGVTL